MPALPVVDPGVPDRRSPSRLLLWLAARTGAWLTAGIVFGIVWMVSQALMPAAIGRAVDAITGRDEAELLRWSLLLLALGLTQAGSGVLRHRMASANWLAAAYRTVQVTIDQANRLGATLPRRMAAGEVVSIGTADIGQLGGAMDITARGSGAVVAIGTVTAILLAASVRLGLVVLLGVPVLLAIVGLLIRPLHRRQQTYRDQQAALATRAVDIVAGLRVLRGIGGEPVVSERYRRESQVLRADGVRVARVESLLAGAEILLPGAFVALVTWLGARFVLRGEITAGQLVAFYGYAAFLVGPMRTITEVIDKITKGHVAARRVVDLLRLVPEISDPGTPVPSPGPGELVDAASGLVLRTGRCTALVAAAPEDAVRIADRLGRYAPGEVTLRGVPLGDLPLATVRRRIMVADNDAVLFSGPLRAELDPRDDADEGRITAALRVADATDIVEALPEGLAAPVTARGREFSGGQQQRLRLARALVADPEILILVEPTSAVDAHTEARIADRLGPARTGRTTLICTSSPLVLDRVDHVVFVRDGRTVAEGTHRDLLAAVPEYRATVSRAEAEDPRDDRIEVGR
ncbi:ABC transporter ATP-binding protein [Plantactinospora sp. KBS50]|uniref:ABC transporter transmembrane domain-containing protein n=1 Tax=Plantactinospora sp. KBS50 TaxID=2024580 RepID=UPI000BAAB58D|nr:ABC transporter ATP-binding protein [Plantactinospora sp. KBS50]ASW53605.1 multidrug ABC transporter permease [Plantactinospora sp. KBS50]